MRKRDKLKNIEQANLNQDPLLHDLVFSGKRNEFYV